MDNRAQISAEMLMILAALVGLSVFVLGRLAETAQILYSAAGVLFANRLIHSS